MSFLEAPIPEIGEDDVLIRMKRVGVCGSDIQVYHGRHRYMTFPVVQGHEGAGEVVKAGSRVSGFHAGDRVTVQPQVFCGRCAPCRNGHINVCQNLKVYGVHATGMLSDYFAAPASKVLRLPEGMRFDEGALVEPTAVATGTIRRCGNLAGRNVIVLGAGTIGNLVAQVAGASGAKKTVVTDILPRRLDIARACGIGACVNTRCRKLEEVIREEFGDDKADVIIDCAGVKALFSEAAAAARCASKLVVVANHKEPIEVELPLFQRREVDLLGIMMYLREDFQRAIDLISRQAVMTAPLVTDHFDIRRMEEVYRYIDDNPEKVMKVVIDIGDSGD
jgi:L-iditol 2-dehydrogenase